MPTFNVLLFGPRIFCQADAGRNVPELLAAPDQHHAFLTADPSDELVRVEGVGPVLITNLPPTGQLLPAIADSVYWQVPREDFVVCLFWSQ